MKELSVVYSDNYLKYDLGADNPISRDKTAVFLRKLKKDGEIPYEVIEAPRANDDDVLLAHTQRYLTEVKRAATDRMDLSLDTPVDENTLEAAYFLIGGTILCSNLALQDKRVINLIGGMHHASSHQGSGFCVFNDHAIAIRRLQQDGKIKKATIYDIDVHAGQGTQEIFYEDPSVLTVSIHQDPYTIYPGTGFEWQRGAGEGLGTNINIPLPPGTTETEYLTALDLVLERTTSFSPDLTVLLLGVDTYKGDLLGGFRLEEESFGKIGERFKDREKLAVLFGGGYSTKIPDLWMAFLKGYLE